MLKKVFIILIFFTQTLFSEKVNLGIYIVNIGKFEVATGNFNVDFYLTIKTESANQFPLDSFEFMNGRATHIEKIYSEKNMHQYRILANLTSPVDLRKFPFDEQTLSIIIENKKFTIDQVRYKILENETGIDDSIVFTGWKLKGWKILESEHKYKVFNEIYSLVSLNIIIEKIKINALFKTFIPVLIIIFLVACCSIMDIDKVKERLGICTSCLVASVMLHLSISNQIPPVSYLTYADKFMILTYMVLMLSVILNVLIMQLVQKQKENQAVKLNRIAKYITVIILPSTYSVFFYLCFQT